MHCRVWWGGCMHGQSRVSRATCLKHMNMKAPAPCRTMQSRCFKAISMYTLHHIPGHPDRLLTGIHQMSKLRRYYGGMTGQRLRVQKRPDNNFQCKASLRATKSSPPITQFSTPDLVGNIQLSIVTRPACSRAPCCNHTEACTGRSCQGTLCKH